ncbi:hypothetical protein GVAV_003348 [Gurleya vavrai]
MTIKNNGKKQNKNEEPESISSASENSSCKSSDEENVSEQIDQKSEESESEQEVNFEEKEENYKLQFNNLKDANDKLNITKKNLLYVYLINLHLFNQLPENEKNSSAIKFTLIKITTLLEKIINYKSKIDQKVITNKENIKDCNELRIAPKNIIENKGINRKRKREEMNPRIKNKRKAVDQKQKGKKVFDKNIDTKKSRSDKYK